MKQQFISNDGKVFYTKEECLAHEKKPVNKQERINEIIDKKQEMDELNDTITEFLDDLADLQEELDELLQDYIEDYPGSWSDDLSEIWDDDDDEEDDEDEDEDDCGDDPLECALCKLSQAYDIISAIKESLEG